LYGTTRRRYTQYACVQCWGPCTCCTRYSMCICIHLVWDILLFICGLNAFCLCAYLHFSMQPQEILGVPLTGHTMFLYTMMMSLHQMDQFFRSATNSYEIFLFCLCACIISKCNTRCLCGTVTHNVLVYNVKVNGTPMPSISCGCIEKCK